MHLPINVKFPNNINEWQMGFNLAFKGLRYTFVILVHSLVFGVTYNKYPINTIVSPDDEHRGARNM
jgi:hypothetical protein